jgi:hypothetical protein
MYSLMFIFIGCRYIRAVVSFLRYIRGIRLGLISFLMEAKTGFLLSGLKPYNYGRYVFDLFYFVFLFVCIFINYFIICTVLLLLYLTR